MFIGMKYALFFLIITSPIYAMVVEQKHDKRKQDIALVKFLQKLPGDILVTVFHYKIADLTAKGAYYQLLEIKESCHILASIVSSSTGKKYWKNITQTQQEYINNQAIAAIANLDQRVAENNSIANLQILRRLLNDTVNSQEKEMARRENFCRIFTQDFINPNQPYQWNNTTGLLEYNITGELITQTLMYEAIRRNWLMDLFLAHKADVEEPLFLEKNRNGEIIILFFPLFSAICDPNEYAVNALLKNNANPNAPFIHQKEIKSYSLHNAIEQYEYYDYNYEIDGKKTSLLSIVSLLLEYGASLTSRNSEGLTPVEYAHKILSAEKLVEFDRLLTAKGLILKDTEA